MYATLGISHTCKLNVMYFCYFVHIPPGRPKGVLNAVPRKGRSLTNRRLWHAWCSNIRVPLENWPGCLPAAPVGICFLTDSAVCFLQIARTVVRLTWAPHVPVQATIRTEIRFCDVNPMTEVTILFIGIDY